MIEIVSPKPVGVHNLTNFNQFQRFNVISTLFPLIFRCISRLFNTFHPPKKIRKMFVEINWIRCNKIKIGEIILIISTSFVCILSLYLGLFWLKLCNTLKLGRVVAAPPPRATRSAPLRAGPRTRPALPPRTRPAPHQPGPARSRARHRPAPNPPGPEPARNL